MDWKASEGNIKMVPKYNANVSNSEKTVATMESNIFALNSGSGTIQESSDPLNNSLK